jgi:hypothetical protein
MKESIGNAAGIIWEFLDRQSGPVNLAALKRSLDLSSNLLMMGLGWLTREDKLDIEVSGNSYSISLHR